MTRRKPQAIGGATRAAWGEMIAGLSRDELVALNHSINRELTRRSRVRRATKNPTQDTQNGNRH